MSYIAEQGRTDRCHCSSCIAGRPERAATVPRFRWVQRHHADASDIAPGDKFGRLTVVEVNDGRVRCRCACGNCKTLLPSQLRVTRSCGCLTIDNRRKYLDARRAGGAQ